MDEDAVMWIHDPTPLVTLHGPLSAKMHLHLSTLQGCSVVFAQLCSQLSDETAASGVRGYESRNDYEGCIVISTGTMQSLTVAYCWFVLSICRTGTTAIMVDSVPFHVSSKSANYSESLSGLINADTTRRFECS